MAGNGHETPKRVRQLDAGEAFTAIRIFDDDGEIETEIGDMWKGVGWIDGQRSERRKDVP